MAISLFAVSLSWTQRGDRWERDRQLFIVRELNEALFVMLWSV